MVDVLPGENDSKEKEDPPPDYPGDKKKPGKVKKSFKRVKRNLQSNKVTTQFFPPKGEVATNLTLIIAVIVIFFCARAVLGPIAAPGGTIFALFILILLSLIAGQIVLQMAALITKIAGVDIKIPSLLGMMAVGITLKNVPYNFGQFGRAECIGNVSMNFADSLHDFVINSTQFQEELMGYAINPADVHIHHLEAIKADTLEDIDFYKNESEPETHTQLSDHGSAVHALHQRDVDESLYGFDDDVLIRKIRSDPHAAEPEEHVDPCKKRFIGHDLDPLLARTLRSICLTVILLMAGLELDPPALWRLKWIVLRTTFVPCIVEAFAAALFCNLILGFPFVVGLCFGFVLCGVSPAVIIPSLVNLGQRGFGVKKGMPTLVIATCSADDLVAIGGFGIAAGITFNPDASISDLASHGPLEVLMGIAFGIFWGYICQWFPSKLNSNYVFFRWIILSAGGLFALFGAHMIHYDGAGGLACVIMAFVASIQWRREGWGDHNPVTDIYNKVWIILSPVIFSLIGTNINAEKMDGATVGLGVAVLFCCFATRSFFTFWSTLCGGFDTKEKIFLSFTWLPKATVQAALGINNTI